MMLGTRFWPQGPQTVDWVFDLQNATFGPIFLGASLQVVRQSLGCPDSPHWFGTPKYLFYYRFGLMVVLHQNRNVHAIHFSIHEKEGDEREPPAAKELPQSPFESSTSPGFVRPEVPFGMPDIFQLRIHLQGQSRVARGMKIDDYESVLGQPAEIFQESKKLQIRKYSRWSHLLFLDIGVDGTTVEGLSVSLRADEG